MIDHPSRAREDSYLISDSSMFSEIDCEIDSDFRLSWRIHCRTSHYPLMVSTCNLNVKRCMIDDWI